MPYLFDPDAAVLYASPPDVEIDEAAFALEEEEFLLTHKCRRSAECQTERVMGQKVTRSGSNYIVEPEPHCLLRIDFDQQLEYQIDATALSLQGLANHHPGAGLDDYALAFVNGNTGGLPFRFTGGTWIYMDPSQECTAGDLAEISFRVVREFTDIMEGTGEPVDPDSFTVIPAQAAGQPVVAVAQTAALEDVFHGTSSFSGTLTARLYNGDPLLGGVAVSEAVEMAPWTELNIAAHTDTVQLRNPEELSWIADGAARTVTHVLYKRGAMNIAAGVLDAAVEVPAGYGIRADVRALAMELSWPIEGIHPDDIEKRAGAYVLKYITGSGTLPAGDFIVEAWNAAPVSPDAILFNSFTVIRDPALWSVIGDIAANINDLNGLDLAPIEGWPVIYYSLRFNALPDVYINSKLISGWIIYGNPLHIPAGGMDLELYL